MPCIWSWIWPCFCHVKNEYLLIFLCIHMKLRRDVVKLLEDEIISIDYVKSEMNSANSLTKLMGRKLILQTSKEMGLRPIWLSIKRVTQPMWLEIPWSRFIWVVTSWYWHWVFELLLIMRDELLTLNEFIVLVDGVFKAVYTWWIHLYEKWSEAAPMRLWRNL